MEFLASLLDAHIFAISFYRLGFFFPFPGIGRSICMHNPGDEKRIKAGDRLLLRLQTGGRSFEMVVVLVMVYLFEGCSAVDAGGGNAHNGLSTRTTVYVDGSWWALPTSDVPVLLLPFRVACKLAREWSSSSSLPRQTLLLCLITSRIQCYCRVQVFAKDRRSWFCSRKTGTHLLDLWMAWWIRRLSSCALLRVSTIVHRNGVCQQQT